MLKSELLSPSVLVTFHVINVNLVWKASGSVVLRLPGQSCSCPLSRAQRAVHHHKVDCDIGISLDRRASRCVF